MRTKCALNREKSKRRSKRVVVRPAMASLFRRPASFFPVSQAPELLFSLAMQRGSPRLCRACCSREVHGTGSRGPKLSARERRMARTELLRRNRRNPELERAARTRILTISLSEVQSEWQQFRGLDQLQTAGAHFNLYRDLYGRPFRPRGFMEVEYGDKAVHRGTIITPTEAASPPRVSALPTDTLCSLVLSNPDGHLLLHEMEVLHWMVLNIRGGDISSGEEMVPYLQPVPPRGSGLHRHVFSLYTHHDPIDADTVRPPSEGSWLDQRTFSTAQFLSAHPSLQTFTFSLAQSQWDCSVHTAYMEALVYPEPVYGVEEEVTPRRQRQELTRLRKASHYRLM